MKKIRNVGYQLVFTTSKSLDEIEEILDNALSEMETFGLSLISQMSKKEAQKVMEEYIKGFNQYETKQRT